mgnify:CR=1 FL=1
MKKLVYGVLTSAILLSNANSHEIWIEKDKKNEANIFFGEFADGQKEGDKFLDRLKVDTFYPKDIVKNITRKENSIVVGLSKDSDLILVETGEPRLNKNTQVTARKISYAKTGRTTTIHMTAKIPATLKRCDREGKVVNDSCSSIWHSRFSKGGRKHDKRSCLCCETGSARTGKDRKGTRRCVCGCAQGSGVRRGCADLCGAAVPDRLYSGDGHPASQAVAVPVELYL